MYAFREVPAGSIGSMYPTGAMAGKSTNVSNKSDTQPLSHAGNQLPAMTASAFGPQYTPGLVRAPFASPFVASATAVSRPQFYVQPPISSAIQPMVSVDNFSCTVVSVDGLELGQGCVVKKGTDAPVTVDLTGTNPFTFQNGANNITVIGDPESQKCNVQYSDAFDTATFYVEPNASRFNVCI